MSELHVTTHRLGISPELQAAYDYHHAKATKALGRRLLEALTAVDQEEILFGRASAEAEEELKAALAERLDEASA